MKLKGMRKFLSANLMILSVALLSGCGENPLSKYDELERAKILCEANTYAYKRCGKKIFYMTGFYDLCVKGREDEKFCKSYYKNMASFLSKKIGSTSISDLTDKKVVMSVLDNVATGTAWDKCDMSFL